VKKHLDGFTPLSEKDKHCAAAGISADSFRDDSRQSVKAPAQVDGLNPDENFHAVRNHGRLARAPWASISSNRSENVARSKPRGTTM